MAGLVNFGLSLGIRKESGSGWVDKKEESHPSAMINLAYKF